MTGPISSGKASGPSAIRLGGGKGKAGSASTAMSRVAINVASSIAEELGLAVDPDGRRKGSARDFYGVEAAADELVAEQGGTAADRGKAAQLLHGFAQEIASLVAARPGSRSVAEIEQAISTAGRSEISEIGTSLDRALRLIEETTHKISGQKI